MSTTLVKATFPDLGNDFFHFGRNARRILQRKGKAGVVYIAIDPISG